jgi:hypothetical protein
MSKLIELKEAAALLGVTPEQLTDLRSRSKIFGYRDGSTWKFKEAELQRYADQNGIELGAAPAPPEEPPKKSGKPATIPAVDAGLEELVDVDIEDDLDSILVSDKELGSGPGASSTIIGREELAEDLHGSDLKLSSVDDGGTAGSALRLDEIDDLKLEPSASGSELKLEASGSSLELDMDDLDLTLGSGLAGGSELKLSGGSEIDLSAGPSASGSAASDFDIDFEDGSELKLASDSPAKPANVSGSDLLGGEPGKGSSDTGNIFGSGLDDDLILDSSSAGGSEASLDLGDDELLLEGSDNISGLNFDESGIDLDIASGTDVGLIQDGSGSDVTLNAGDSGINLAKPSESGISLETESIELGGSGVEALELGEADIVDLDGSGVDFEGATQLKADDDFLLSPVEGVLGDDADSGSQVIALDTEEFGEADDSMLGGAQVIDVDEEFGALPDGGAGGVAVVAGPGMAPVAGGEPPEAPYSLYNVLGLAGCMLLLSLTGIMMIDMLRNMWSWSEPYSINSKLMDFIISMFGK